MWPEGFEFHHPWLLLLAIPALGAVILRRRARWTRPAVRYPSVGALRGLPRSLRQRLSVVVPLCEAFAAVAFVLALARPRLGDQRTVIRNEGIAIQMVLDRSGSMEEPMRFRGRMRRRIDIVKDVFKEFVLGGNGLPGRKTDLIGLTTFARFTEESCPLVAEHEPLITAVENLTTVPAWLDAFDQPVRDPPRSLREVRERGLRENPLNRTAIGDGLFRAVTSLITAEEDLARGEGEGGYKIKGKVIILLTDGRNNAGEMDPVEAGRYAAENGIRVYYILLHELVERRMTIFGQEVERELSRDELLEEPRKVAGDPSRAFLATDGDALEKIYREIDRLERTDIGRVTYYSYKERYHLFLVPGIALLLLAFFLDETWLRRLP